jgi:hypothetical protein
MIDLSMQLSPSFTLGEMIASAKAEELGIDNTEGLTPERVENLRLWAVSVGQPLRDYTGLPITILSGYRCPQLNEAVGGEPTSQHLTGDAADIVVGDMPPLAVVRLIRSVPSLCAQVGQAISEFAKWTHLSRDHGPKPPRRQFLVATRNTKGEKVYVPLWR